MGMHASCTTRVRCDRMADWLTKLSMQVNSPACKHCGSKETKAQGAAQPLSEEEVQGRAGMVEVYSCIACGKMTRCASSRASSAAVCGPEKLAAGKLYR